MLLLQWCSGLPGWGFLFSLTCLVFGKIMDTCSWKQTSKSSILLLELSGAYIWSFLFTYMYLFKKDNNKIYACYLDTWINIRILIPPIQNMHHQFQLPLLWDMIPITWICTSLLHIALRTVQSWIGNLPRWQGAKDWSFQSWQTSKHELV